MERLSEEEILEKWEPKVHKMVRSASINGYEYDDIAQELRLSILRAHKKYDPTLGKAEFGTYLHISMLNVIRGLINQAQKKPVMTSLDRTFNDGLENEYTRRIGDVIEDEAQQDEFDVVELRDLENSLNLTSDEKLFIKMKLEGFRLNEITPCLTSGTAAKVRDSIRQKIGDYIR